MKNLINFLFGFLAIVLIILFIDNKTINKENSFLDLKSKEAINYYNLKYQTKETIIKSEYGKMESFLGGEVNDLNVIYIQVSDGNEIIYDKYSNTFIDNKQSIEITEAIYKYLSEILNQKIDETYFIKTSENFPNIYSHYFFENNLKEFLNLENKMNNNFNSITFHFLNPIYIVSNDFENEKNNILEELNSLKKINFNIEIKRAV